jgi:hypothetical protein
LPLRTSGSKHGLRKPVYFRFILTVDNLAAERFARLDGVVTERAIRDAIQKTFREWLGTSKASSRSISTVGASGRRTRTYTHS